MSAFSNMRDLADRLAMALELGATDTVNAAEEDAVESILDRTLPFFRPRES